MNLSEHLKARAALGWKGLPPALSFSTVTANALGGAPGAEWQFHLTGIAPANMRQGLRITTRLTPAVGEQAALLFAGGSGPPGITKAASGVHPLFATARFDGFTAGGGAATVTRAATVYIEGPPTGGATNLSLLIDAGDVQLAKVGLGQNTAYATMPNENDTRALTFQMRRSTIAGAFANAANGGAEVYASGGAPLSIFTGGDAAMHFGVNALERLRITTNGYLKASNDGIVSQPTGNYHEFNSNQDGVLAEFRNRKASLGPQGVIIYFSEIAPNSASYYMLWCGDNNAPRAIIQSNGGLHNYSANNVNLSDTTKKTGRQPVVTNWQKMRAVRNAIEEFKYIEDVDQFGGAARQNVGPSAQIVQAEYPEYVIEWSGPTEEDPDAPVVLGVREMPLMWRMFANIVDTLEVARQRINELTP